MPTTRQDRSRGAPRAARAPVGVTLAVAALYALVLQAVLGGIAALPVAGAPGRPCLSQAEESSVPDDQHGPARHHTGCCAAACHAGGPSPPPAALGLAAVPERDGARIGPRTRPPLVGGAPPSGLASARAPPAV